MGERTGLGLVEMTILRALGALGAGHDDDPLASGKVLGVIEDAIGLAPGYTYQILCDLARSWISQVPLVSVVGDLGGPDPQDEVASPRYTLCRLTRAGEIVLSVEDGELAPVPLGLVNGNHHAGGERPPFELRRVLNAIESLLRDPSMSDSSLQHLVGPPSFPTGCAVETNLAALFAGEPSVLRLLARIRIQDTRLIVIDHIPPGAGVHTTAEALIHRSKLFRRYRNDPRQSTQLGALAGLAIKWIEVDVDRNFVVCEPDPDVDLEDFVSQLQRVYPVETTVQARLPGGLPNILRTWARAHGPAETEVSFAALLEACEL